MHILPESPKNRAAACAASCASIAGASVIAGQVVSMAVLSVALPILFGSLALIAILYAGVAWCKAGKISHEQQVQLGPLEQPGPLQALISEVQTHSNRASPLPCFLDQALSDPNVIIDDEQRGLTLLTYIALHTEGQRKGWLKRAIEGGCNNFTYRPDPATYPKTFGYTALLSALANSLHENATLLIKEGGEEQLNLPSLTFGTYPLHIISANGYQKSGYDLAETMLSRGANPNVTFKKARGDVLEVLNSFPEQKSALQQKYPHAFREWSPLDFAILRRDAAMVKLFLSHQSARPDDWEQLLLKSQANAKEIISNLVPGTDRPSFPPNWEDVAQEIRALILQNQ